MTHNSRRSLREKRSQVAELTAMVVTIILPVINLFVSHVAGLREDKCVQYM